MTLTHVLGQAFHQNAFEAVFLLANSDQVRIKCCDGNANEIATALALLNSGSNIVLDLAAVATLSLLDVTSVLYSFPGKFRLSSGTIDELREMVATTLRSAGEMGYAGKSEEGYYMISETEADRKERAESLLALKTAVFSLSQFITIGCQPCPNRPERAERRL